MPTVIRADSGQDFLALVPRLTGYQPHDSIVLVAFRGKRTCGALRFDLPGPLPLADLRRVSTGMIGTLCRISGVDAVVPVAYTTHRFDGGDAVPQAVFVDVLTHRAERAGLRVRDALCVAPDGWGSYFDPDLPPGGRPLAAIAASAVNAIADEHDFPSSGADVVGPVDLPPVDLATAERIARRLRALRCRSAGSVDLGIVEPVEPAVDLPVLDFLAHVLDTPVGEIAPDAFADLAWQLSSPHVRDTALLLWAFGPEVGAMAWEFQLRSLAGLPADPGQAALLLWGEGPRPDPARIERAVELVWAVAARVPRSARTPLFSQLAWLTWALGRSSRAAHYVEAALRIDPDYGLAQLIGAMIAGGRIPDWAFDVPDVDEDDVRYAGSPRVSAR